VKVWKVILATIVIFAAGAIAGGILVKTLWAPVPEILSRQFFQARLKRELQLSADQTNRIDKIFSESNERLKIIRGLVAPEEKKELQEVRDSIRAILTAEQREKFEQLLKQPHRPDGQRRRPGGTNSPTALTNQVK
jgi:hypothetical protein